MFKKYKKKNIFINKKKGVNGIVFTFLFRKQTINILVENDVVVQLFFLRRALPATTRSAEASECPLTTATIQS